MQHTTAAMLRQWRDQAVATHGPAAVAKFVREHGDLLEALVADYERLQRTPKRVRDRIARNVKALRLLERGGPYSPEDLAELERYTGWGGLPEESLPVSYSEIDEYYTPPPLANAIGQSVAQLIGGLAPVGTTIRALEPSAGIGHLMRAVDAACPRASISWIGVERAKHGAEILSALRPYDEIANTTFESWVRDNTNRVQGLHLVIANPPFAARGLTTDVPAEYREGPAYAYFLRRCLDLLCPGGLAVFLVPGSFLSSELRRPLRTRVLARATLLGAYRLPRRVFPGADRRTDMIVLRARSGVHTGGDDYVVNGEYFDRHPDRVLSTVEIPEVTGDETSCSAGEESDLQGLPPPQSPTAEAATLALGRRIRSYRERCASACEGGHRAWVELVRDLEDFLGSEYLALRGNANPWEWRELKGDGADDYRRAFTRTGVLSLASQPPARPTYRGDPDNLTNQAMWLAARDKVYVDTLFELHRSVGGGLEREDVAALAGWNVCRDGEMLPDDVFYTGDLWAKLDNLRGVETDKARVQTARLRKLIAAVPVEDIAELSPRAGWMPVEIIAGWLTVMAQRDGVETAFTLERSGDRLVVANAVEALPATLDVILAWLNYETLADGRGWASNFAAWAMLDPDRRHVIADAYNRAVRGFACQEHAPDDLTIPRWNGELKLHVYQRRAAAQMLDTPGGLIAFDTGLGKTYAALAVLAAARRDGLARRPVILVPKSLAWKWYGAIQRALPDYRVAIVGSKLCRRERGRDYLELVRRRDAGEMSPREFEAARITSRSDSPQERAEKWEAFRNGAFDVVIMTLPMLEHLGTDPVTHADYVASLGSLAGQVGHTTNDGPLSWFADFLVVDEIQKFKNLFQPHEDFRPRYMGVPTPSRRALRLHAIAYATRSAGGRVYGVTATPADNSPLELYNLLHIVDPAIWERAGIYSPTAFVDRYVQVETRAVPDSKFELVEKPTAVGFKNLRELNGIICRYTALQNVEDAGLKLPVARNHVIEVELNKRQRAKIARYIKRLENHPNEFLGTQIKLSLVAVHPELDGGYTWDSAGSVGPQSPKFGAIAERVIAGDCNHIIFLECPAAQRWMVEVLARSGLPRERMAVLNGATPSAERQKIATTFNRGGYKVVVANSVAHEGLDLHLQTCGIHHGDLPWGPKSLEQRNGRAVRQNNPFESVEVYYYVAKGSIDRYRLSLIEGKATWLRALDGSKDRISNPAAELFIDRDDLLMHFSSEGAERLLEQRRKQASTTQLEEQRQAAAALAYRAAARFRDAREARDTELATRRHCEGTALLRELAQVDPQVWPWAAWMGAAREVMPLVPRDGSAPVFEGLRIVCGEALEFGRTGYDGREAIGVRRSGTGLWVPMVADDITALDIRPHHMPGRGQPWPSNDRADAIAWIESNAKRLRGVPWPQWGWHFAADRWVSSIWPDVAKVVAYNVQKNTQQRLPILRDHLELAYGADVLGNLLAPTLQGWRLFVHWAAQSDIDEDELEAAGRYWWGRALPRRDT